LVAQSALVAQMEPQTPVATSHKYGEQLWRLLSAAIDCARSLEQDETPEGTHVPDWQIEPTAQSAVATQVPLVSAAASTGAASAASAPPSLARAVGATLSRSAAKLPARQRREEPAANRAIIARA
jgi:hypothetical protein